MVSLDLKRLSLSFYEGLLLPDEKSLRVSREVQVYSTVKTPSQGCVCVHLQPSDLLETQLSDNVEHQLFESQEPCRHCHEAG